jgi:hypothetical protein
VGIVDRIAVSVSLRTEPHAQSTGLSTVGTHEYSQVHFLVAYPHVECWRPAHDELMIPALIGTVVWSGPALPPATPVPYHATTAAAPIRHICTGTPTSHSPPLPIAARSVPAWRHDDVPRPSYSVLHPCCIRVASVLHPCCIRVASALHPCCIRAAFASHRATPHAVQGL